MDGVEAVWSVLDGIGDWMSSILDIFTGAGEDSDTDVKGETIAFSTLLGKYITPEDTCECC